jgi:[CysO sulfur-carrier protein]-S-L-cysteine hydrolase
MRVARSMLDRIVAQAREEAPNECCGIVGTRDGRAVTLYRLRNAAASPLRYEIDPREQLRTFEALDEAGLEAGIIYHSHTRSAPLPSQTDINLAFYPDALYLIVGVAERDDDVRAWRIVDGQVAEAPLEIVED